MSSMLTNNFHQLPKTNNQLVLPARLPHILQKNSAIAGAIAGAAVALTGDAGGHSDKLVHFAITGAALSSAASLLSGIF